MCKGILALSNVWVSPNTVFAQHYEHQSNPFREHASASRSKEVVSHRLLRRHAPRVLWRGLEDSVTSSGPHLPFLLPRLQDTCCTIRVAISTRCVACIRTVFAELQNRGNIATAVAIVGSAPHCDDRAVEHFFEALHYKLMSSAYEAEIVLVIEALDDVGTEEESSTTWRKTPAVDLIWIRPEKVTHSAFVWNFLLAVKQSDLVDAVDEGRKAAVNA